MVRSIIPVILSCFFAACGKFGGNNVSPYLKTSLIEMCGEQETECIDAVTSQFDTCHQKNIKDWDFYLEASLKKQDRYLEVYSKNMYGCIVDTEGKPFFEFSP